MRFGYGQARARSLLGSACGGPSQVELESPVHRPCHRRFLLYPMPSTISILIEPSSLSIFGSALMASYRYGFIHQDHTYVYILKLFHPSLEVSERSVTCLRIATGPIEMPSWAPPPPAPISHLYRPPSHGAPGPPPVGGSVHMMSATALRAEGGSAKI